MTFLMKPVVFYLHKKLLFKKVTRRFLRNLDILIALIPNFQHFFFPTMLIWLNRKHYLYKEPKFLLFSQ